MPRSEPGRRAAFAIALLSLVPLLSALGHPFSRDDFNSLYQAGLTWKEPAHLADPWMGGFWRHVPKLFLTLLLGAVGPVSWLFRLVNLLCHATIVYLAARVLGRRARSTGAGYWAAGLFAAGFGYYAAAPIQVSNITMLSATVLVLLAWRLLQLGRRGLAALALAVAALCHELAWGAILFLPFAVDDDAPAPARYALTACLVAFGLALLVPGRVGAYASTETQYWIFGLLPLNATLTASTPLPAALEGTARAFVALRPWLGLAALLGAIALSWRARGAWTAAVAWMVILTLPFAAAIAFWPEVWPPHWLSRRYLYAPALGLCFLAALGLMRLAPGRRRWAGGALVAWALAWSALAIWGAGREARGPAQTEIRVRWAQEMENLDPRWSPSR